MLLSTDKKMIIAIYVKFGNIEKYFQSNKDLFRKIKSSLSNLFRKDVDFLIDLLATSGEHSVSYENYLEEKELLEDFCNQINSCHTLEDIQNLIHPKHNCKLFMKSVLIR